MLSHVGKQLVTVRTWLGSYTCRHFVAAGPCSKYVWRLQSQATVTV